MQGNKSIHGSDVCSVQINEIVALRGKMAQAVVGKKFGIEQTEVSAIQRLQRAKTARLVDEIDKRVRFFHSCSKRFGRRQIYCC